MNKFLIIVLTLLCFSRLDVAAQTPNLPTKGVLSETILSTKSFTNSTQTDIAASATVFTATAQPGNISGNTTVSIKSKNIVCGSNGDKVSICHKGKTICIASLDVQDHLSHGDMLGGCIATASIATSNNILEEAAAYQVRMYPNPVTEVLNIQVSKLATVAMVQVFNAHGAVMLTQRLTNTMQSLSVKVLTPGIYYVKVSNGDKVTTEKIIKQ